MFRPTLALWFCAVWLVGSLAACSAPPRTGEEEYMLPGDDNPAIPECDVAGEIRCEGLTQKSCLRGRWRVKQTCLIGQVCDANLGCIQCNPALPTTCEGDTIRK